MAETKKFEKMRKHARLHRMVMKGGQGTESREKSLERALFPYTRRRSHARSRRDIFLFQLSALYAMFSGIPSAFEQTPFCYAVCGAFSLGTGYTSVVYCSLILQALGRTDLDVFVLGCRMYRYERMGWGVEGR